MCSAGAVGKEEGIGRLGAGTALFPGDEHFLDGAKVTEAAARHAASFGDDIGIFAAAAVVFGDLVEKRGMESPLGLIFGVSEVVEVRTRNVVEKEIAGWRGLGIPPGLR